MGKTRFLIERLDLKKVESLKRSGGNAVGGTECEIAFIDERYLPDLLKLQELIIQSLSDKEIFKFSSEEVLRNLFVTERSVIGAFTEECLIAYSIIHLPAGDGDNLGADIGIDDGEMCNVGHIKAVAVHPAYRGNSLQRKMMGVHLNVLKDIGCRHVCSTVSPKNFPSVLNFFSIGMVIEGLNLKFDGLLRYIMHMDLNSPFDAGSERFERIKIDGQDIPLQLD